MSVHDAVVLRTDHRTLNVLYCFECMHALAYSPREEVLRFIRELHRGGDETAEPRPDDGA